MIRPSERLDLLAISTGAIVLAVYYTVVASHVTIPGLPLDDAWIHLQFARNLGTGHGFSFNPGVPSSGSTAPLWTFVLAIPAFLRIDLLAAARVIGVALTIAAALTARQIVAWLTNSRLGATTAGLAVVLSARFTWASVSGMEVPLYTTLALLTVLFYLRGLHTGRAGLWSIAAALTGTARPEAFMFLPIFIAHWAWSRRSAGLWRSIRGPCAIAGVVVAGYVAFNFATGGHPLPTTFYAKARGEGVLGALMQGQWTAIGTRAISAPIEDLNILLHWVDEQSPFLMLAVLVGACVLAGVLPMRNANLAGGGIIVVLFLAAPILKGAFVPAPPILAQNGRYIDHLLAMYFMIASVGLAYLWTATRRHWLVATFVLVALVRLASQDVKFAPRYAAEVKNINELQVVAADWIRQHTTPEAIVATNDIGALAYFGRRTIVDTEGLISPEALAYRRDQTIAAYLAHTMPDLLVIFPGWYPELADRPDLLREVCRITSPRVVAWGDTLVVYRMPWTRPGVVSVPAW